MGRYGERWGDSVRERDHLERREPLPVDGDAARALERKLDELLRIGRVFWPHAYSAQSSHSLRST